MPSDLFLCFLQKHKELQTFTVTDGYKFTKKLQHLEMSGESASAGVES